MSDCSLSPQSYLYHITTYIRSIIVFLYVGSNSCTPSVCLRFRNLRRLACWGGTSAASLEPNHPRVNVGGLTLAAAILSGTHRSSLPHLNYQGACGGRIMFVQSASFFLHAYAASVGGRGEARDLTLVGGTCSSAQAELQLIKFGCYAVGQPLLKRYFGRIELGDEDLVMQRLGFISWCLPFLNRIFSLSSLPF